MKHCFYIIAIIIFVSCFGSVQSINCTYSLNETNATGINTTQCQCQGLSIWNNDTLRCQCQLGVSLQVDDSCLDENVDQDNLTCQFPCSTCSAIPTNCQTCALNYILDNNQCFGTSQGVLGTLEVENSTIQCSGGCIQCQSYQVCSKCIFSYQLISGQCSRCQNNCKTCDGGNCLSCFFGYYLSSTSCVSCSEDQLCLECNSTSCSVCKQGYFVENQTCSQCGKFCLQCTSSSSCSTCQPGYVVPTGGSSCVECLLGCISCSQSDISICLQCNQGFYNNSGICAICPQSCSQCTSTSVCSSCSDGYIFQNNQCRQACVFPCMTCQTNTSACLSCFGGYTLSNKQCIEDLSCNNANSCTYCPRTYTINNISQCVSCQVSNCIKCQYQNPSICIQCVGDYYLNNNSCVQCPSQCESCFSLLYCTQCESGYFMAKRNLQPTGQCLACSAQSHCETCRDSSTQCLTCLSNYELQNTKCISTKNIGYQLELDTDKNSFMLNINTFKSDLLSVLQYNTSQTNLITFTSLQEGSVLLNGLITLKNQSEAQDVFNRLSSSLSSNNQIGSINLLSAAVLQKNNFSSTNQQQSSQSVSTGGSQSNVGLIVGITIACVALLLIIIWAIIRCRRSNRQKYYVQQDSREKFQKQGIQLQMSF